MRLRLSNPKLRLMTPEELELLKTVSARGTLELAPKDPAYPDPRFARTLTALKSLHRVGWIGLQLAVAAQSGVETGEEVVSAVARCTAEGRRLLVILGE
ncbi:MAG TPA: hypothetical protein VHR43_08810 [Gemmatimonadales bacterium]|nr:hypothetical protein [Gemmatimonadales bacterium]